MVHVRAATREDRAGIIACARAFELLPTSDDHVGALVDLALVSETLFVAIDRFGDVVGLALGVVLPHPYGGFLYLDWVACFVHPDYRDTAAGVGLLRRILRLSSTAPLDLVKMSAPMGSRLGTLLERAGFAPAEVTFVKGAVWRSLHS